MEKVEMTSVAMMAVEKGLSFERLYYSDEMDGREEFTDEVWEYVAECKEFGTVAFERKYKS